jgi:hypothetical protein
MDDELLDSFAHRQGPRLQQIRAPTRTPCGRRGKPNPVWSALRDRRTRCLLARATVDAFTQQIGVADVAGILLDEVDDDVARLDLLAVDVDRRVKL